MWNSSNNILGLRPLTPFVVLNGTKNPTPALMRPLQYTIRPQCFYVRGWFVHNYEPLPLSPVDALPIRNGSWSDIADGPLGGEMEEDYSDLVASGNVSQTILL
jgi:hypothetical protein